MTYVKSITFHLIEEERVCTHCKKSLCRQDGTLFILAPAINKAYELCSWYCLYKFVIKFLKDKVSSEKLKKTDLLKKLGLSLNWGVKLSKEDLETPISDPVEDQHGGISSE